MRLGLFFRYEDIWSGVAPMAWLLGCIAGAGMVRMRSIARILLTAFVGASLLKRRVLIIGESEELAHSVACQQQEGDDNVVTATLVLSNEIPVATVSSISIAIQHSDVIMLTA